MTPGWWRVSRGLMRDRVRVLDSTIYDAVSTQDTNHAVTCGDPQDARRVTPRLPGVGEGGEGGESPG